MTHEISVVIFSDEPVVRALLRAFFEKEKYFTVVGEVSGLVELQQIASKFRPHVIVLASPPGTPDGVAAALRATRKNRLPNVVLLTRAKDPAKLLTFLHAGASGYVTLSGRPEYLYEAIVRAARGERFIDPSFSDNLAEVVLASTKFIPPACTARKLSERERLVLRLVAEGLLNKAIAARIGISVKTVETYQVRLREKLGLRARIDLVRYALSAGILEKFSEPDEGSSPDGDSNTSKA
jgi:two-component system, NarL family, response regulator NreC